MNFCYQKRMWQIVKYCWLLLLLLKGFTQKLYGYFYSHLSVKQEKATHNNNNNNPSFKNRLGNLNADSYTNPLNPPYPLNPPSPSNPPNSPSPLNRLSPPSLSHPSNPCLHPPNPRYKDSLESLQFT